MNTIIICANDHGQNLF